ncbi:MAG: hypothetical protein KJ561_05955 [Nanoarchaeota archaeon]|nr:hypothetical protein [Nanoarchaeota archaeon]
MRKKAQMQSEVVRVFIAAIVIILALYFGIKGFNSVMDKKCQSDMILFEKDLSGSMSAIASQTGTVDQKQYSIPCKIDKVYFIDLNEELDEDFDPSSDNENPEIKDSYDAHVEKNVFFMKDGKVTDSIYVPELTLKYPYYRCFDMLKRPRMDFYLEGYSGGANVVNKDDSANCGYIPVLMDDETVNAEIIEGKNTNTPDQATAAILRAGSPNEINEDVAKQMIEKTKDNVFIGRKVDIKKTGTGIKIRIKPEKGKTASDFTYVESIPKGCIENLFDYFSYDHITMPEISDIFEDPVIVWNFGDEQITDKKEVEYELTSPEDCMRIINSLGFGDIS